MIFDTDRWQIGNSWDICVYGDNRLCSCAFQRNQYKRNVPNDNDSSYVLHVIKSK